ncbi:MAG: ATP-binding protein [Lachnospiraceae bacterium]
MKSKIYGNMCLLALFSMVIATLITTWFFCRDMQTQMKDAVITEVRYIEPAIELLGEDYLSYLDSRGDGNRINRITWMDASGNVLYDSFADRKGMENHAARPEITMALQNGVGQSVRISDTLAEQTFYYATRLSDGTVIRVASTMRSGLAAMINTIPWMIVMAVAIFALTMLVAVRQTSKIVEPINRLDPEAPQAEKIYDELSPLVRRLEKQRQTIRRQMNLLKEKQKEFAAIMENMKEGFIVVDNFADVISYNTSALQILGAEGEQLKGKNQNILGFNRSNAFRQAVESALRGEHNEQYLELDGRYYQIIANPVTESAERKGAVIVILDVTEQQRREELRREFSANVSHELKTPLTSISGYAEIMKDGLVQPEDMRRFSENIYLEAQRMITLVGDIIKLSRLDEEQAGDTAFVDLYQKSFEVIERLKDAAEKNGITITLTGIPAAVRGAEPVLDEMIYNLCDNAIKYNHPGGAVEVIISQDQGHPVITVADTGIGIAKGQQKRIFERFYRVDKSHSRQIGGTGLGLSIVKHGAAYHKARIELDSALGKGTKMRIIF